MKRNTPRLPLQRRRVGQLHRAGRRGREPHFLRELHVLLGVAAGEQRRRRVVQVGEVVGLPADEAGRRRERELLPGVAREERRRVDVAIGVPLEVARRVERIARAAPPRSFSA